ncbi:MAG: hypothetical protein AB1758_08765 [Candidatus Eremiobacterota bacterium]
MRLESLRKQIRDLREELEQCRTDLMLSYECLAIEQSVCKAAEREVDRLCRELRLEQAECAKARAWLAHFKEVLLHERRHHHLQERAFKEALRAELRDQARLAGRLEAAQQRIRELEELLRPQTDRRALSAMSVTPLRLWVDGWVACCSLS